MRIRRRQSRRQNHINDIPLTPLIDTALTLLVIFMIATPIMQNSIKIALPYGQNKENTKAEQNEITIYIDSNEELYLDNVKVNKTELIDNIKKLVSADQEKTVYIKADRAGVKYGTVIELVDDIKIINGVKYVALATQKRPQHNPSLV